MLFKQLLVQRYSSVINVQLCISLDSVVLFFFLKKILGKKNIYGQSGIMEVLFSFDVIFFNQYFKTYKCSWFPYCLVPLNKKQKKKTLSCSAKIPTEWTFVSPFIAFVALKDRRTAQTGIFFFRKRIRNFLFRGKWDCFTAQLCPKPLTLLKL